MNWIIEKDNVRFVLALFFGAVGYVFLFCVLLFDVPEHAQKLLGIVTGGVIAMETTILNYYFGSSKGSADKDKRHGSTKI